MDPAHPFPFISNLSINLLVVTKYQHDAHPFLNRIKVPTGVGIPRFIRVGREHLYIRFEDLIANNLSVVFPGLVIESCAFFRVTRNAITEQDGANANDLLAVIETALRNRKFAEIVRLEWMPICRQLIGECWRPSWVLMRKRMCSPWKVLSVNGIFLRSPPLISRNFITPCINPLIIPVFLEIRQYLSYHPGKGRFSASASLRVL